jgi:AP-2 complex subunit alpha
VSQYVAKLVYIHLLGYEVDFGHMEALRLLSSTEYQEKQIGYMALSILLHENHDMMPLIVNSCKVDLDSRNSMFQALALSAIANLGGREMADALGATVIKLISGSTTKAFVVKRALLALLRLYRKSPDVAMHASLKPLLAQLVLSPDAGIQMAAASLLLGVAKDNVDEYESLRLATADALHRMVVKKEFKKQYTFYGVPSPWLQVKLLRFHRHYAAPGVQAASLIDQSLKAIYASANDDSPASRGVNYRNARQAVLQEAIALVVQQRRKPELVRHTVTLLGSFLTAKTTNVRYLALDALVNVAIVGVERAALRRHTDTIMKMLEDPDVSIRRRALDVLYCMCDEQLAKKIVSELLRYLIVADYNVREDLVVKIAILAERFATVYSWYVDVILQLISIAGDFVSDSIWHRVVQIVTNNEDIQEYAVAMAFEALHHPSCHETTVKVGGYLLGEFGHLLADNDGCSPEQQLQVLESKFATVGDSTRGLLLTTFVKMANLYNELTPEVEKVLEAHSADMSPELQKRACEYMALLAQGNDELIASVLDVMPPFPERESNVVEAAERKKREAAQGPRPDTDGVADDEEGDAFEADIVAENEAAEADAFEAANGGGGGGGGGDHSGRHHGLDDTAHELDGDDGSQTPSEVREARARARNRVAMLDAERDDEHDADADADDKSPPRQRSPEPEPEPEEKKKKGKKHRSKDGKSSSKRHSGEAAAPAATGAPPAGGSLLDLFSLDPTPTATAVAPATASSTSSSSLLDLFLTPVAATPLAAHAAAALSGAPPLRESGPIGVALRALTAKNDGVLYEDATVQIGLKSTFENGSGSLSWYHGNKAAAALGSYAFELVANDKVAIGTPAAAPATVGAASQAVQTWSGVTALKAFGDAPLIAVRVGSDAFSLRSPLVPTKFCTPLPVGQAAFFAEWAKYEAGSLAYQQVLQAGRPISRDFCVLLIGAARLAECAGVDPNAANCVGAGQFVSAAGRLAVLVRIEPSAQAKAYRLSVRTPDAELTRGIAAVLAAHLTAI